MDRLELLRYAAACIGLFAPVMSMSAEAGQRPNILWIIAEDMSPDIGCYGNKSVTTPNIDLLAARGMKFNTVFTTGPACSPSRTSLATGVYQTTAGAYHMRYSDKLKPVLPEPIRILPELMRENGYCTGNIRKMCGTGTGKDDWLFRTSQKSWDTRSWSNLITHQPFYCQINLSESHRTFARNKRRPVPEDKVTLPPYYPDHPVSRRDWAAYLEEVNTADELVGRILNQLKRDNLAENTIVYFFSDHGRPMIRGKNWLYDSGTQIPLVIYYPDDLNTPEGYRAGSESADLISAVDLVAETVLMGGGTIPDWMQGRSFLRKGSTPRTHIYTAVDRIGNIDSCSRAVRTKKFKYIRNFKTPGSINASSTAYRRTTHPIFHLLNIMGEKQLLTPVQNQLLQPLADEELYDLENDPYETVNLVGNKAFESVHAELKQQLSEWIHLSKDKGMREDNDAIISHFREYGISNMKRNHAKIEKMRSSVERHFR